MQNQEQATPGRWGSLSFRLSAVFVAVLVAAAFAVGFLFDRGRTEAIEKRELDHLRLHAERGADEVARFVKQLQGDTLFLASTPPIQGIRRALEGGGTDAAGGSNLGQWKERLQQLFLSFGAVRPEYFQLRLIGAQDNGRELVRVERTAEGLEVTPPEKLQQKGERYYFQEAARLKPGDVYLSRVDLNREHGQIGVPHLPTLRAATPVQDPAGNLFGVLVVNMDLRWPFERAQSFRNPTETVYIADERGDFLLHPEPGRAFALEFGKPFRLLDAFPDHPERLLNTLADGMGFLKLSGDPHGSGNKLVAYLTTRAWDPQDPNRRLVYLLAEPMGQALNAGESLRRESLLGVGGLLALAIVLVVVMVRRLTRSLTALAKASGDIAGGHYPIELQATAGGETASLVLAFQRMAEEVKRREEALAKLTRELERRVEERTAELTRQAALQKLILENIADGIVVVDRGGHFLLWNRKAEQIVGSGPDEVRPELWSWHFGVFRDEAGEPVPPGELPLARAIRGECSDNLEMYLRSPNSEDGRWVQVTARPLLAANGEIAGGVAVLVDVTERKRLRQHVESHRTELAKVGLLAFRAEIASAAAHQLSQPIAAMSNYAGAAIRLHKQGRLGEGEAFDLLGLIETLAQQAGQILNRLRALIRRRNLPAVPIDVNQVADSCLDFLSERILRGGVRVERRYGRELPRPMGDPIELEHVLIQLVLNALDAMEGIAFGEPRLSIGTGQDPEAGLIVIEVADTGPGVSPALTEHLFEPWQTDKPDALGIGLTVAQTLIEMRKGRIRMENGEAGGARFRIELPIGWEEEA